MRKFKSLFILLLLTVSMAATAQTTFKEAFKAYLETNPSFTNLSPENMRNVLEMMNSGLMKDYDEAKSTELVNNYLKGPFVENMVDVMLPYFENKISVDELKELTAILQTEKGKAYQQHSAKINEAYDKFEKIGADIASQFLSGQEPAPIQSINCPESYKKLFQQYYKESGMEDLMASMFNGLTNTMTDEQKSKMDKFNAYMLPNLCTILLNESYGTLTEDDLRFGIELGSNQAFKKQKEAVSSIMSNAQELGMSVVMNYLTWLQGQGVEIKM